MSSVGAEGDTLLGIVAGGGRLPRIVADHAAAQGRSVRIAALSGHADPATVAGYPHLWGALGQAGTLGEWLYHQGVRDLCLIGPVRRPAWSELVPDFHTAKFLASVMPKALGDDGLLRAIKDKLESVGFRVIGAHEILGELVAPEGLLTRTEPHADHHRDIDLGIRHARAIGRLDIGQAVIVQSGLTLAVEAIEGTDAMLGRAADLRRQGPGGVLVKLCKPQQDRRLDLPTIGIDTVRLACAAGLAGIVIEAGRTLIVDRDRTLACADEAGLFIQAIAALDDQTVPP